MTTRRLAVLPVLLGLALALALAAPAAGQAAAGSGDRRVLQGYAADTWRSFELLLDPATGLPSDNVSAAGDRSRYTSPTNIGAYLWSTLAARDTGVISPAEARRRIAATLASVARLERHEPSGMFYNWYDPASGAKLTTWPVDGSPVYPFLSSVDNGWMAAALLMVANAVPQLATRPAPCWPRWTSATTTTRRPGCSGAGSGSTRRAPSAPSPATTAATSPTCSTPATITARSTPSRGSPATSASPSARSRPPTTSGWRGPSRRPATGAGRSSSRPASPGPTWASRCSRATTDTGAWTSCPAGAGACSRP